MDRPITVLTSWVLVLVLACGIAAWWPVLAVSENGKAKSHSSEPCTHLPDPPGKAKGIEKRCRPSGSSAGVARGDFNLDGIGDLAIGAPYEDTGGASDSGAVYVIYGAPSGLTAPATPTATLPGAQRWTQESIGVPGASEDGDLFGAALAAGDFNNDGYPDLAIGVPGEDVTLGGVAYTDTGSVVIIHGSVSGLATSGAGFQAATSLSPPQLTSVSGATCDYTVIVSDDCEVQLPLTPPLIGYDGFAISNARFGAALAWGDFDGDGQKDLAVGAPDAHYHRVTPGPFLLPVHDDTNDVGFAFVAYGKAGTPLAVSGRRAVLWQGRVDGDLAAYDEFATTLSAADFDNDGRHDLVVGVPSEDVLFSSGGVIANVAGAGEVDVFFGCASTLDKCSRTDTIHQGMSGVGSDPEAGDNFGAALATGDFDGDDRPDLAVGIPAENVGNLVDAGAVQIFYFLPGGFRANTQTWTQTSIFGSSPDPFQASPSEAGDQFGFSLAVGDFNGDNIKDLAIGVPYEDVVTNRTGSTTSVSDAGEVDVLYGWTEGLSTSPRNPQVFHQDTINIEDIAETGDRFGWALSAWNFGGSDNLPDLVISVPFEDLAATNCGAVAVIYSRLSNNGLASLGDQLWHQDSANVPGSCGHNDQIGRTVY
jgi:hypothetical protein